MWSWVHRETKVRIDVTITARPNRNIIFDTLDRTWCILQYLRHTGQYLTIQWAREGGSAKLAWILVTIACECNSKWRAALTLQSQHVNAIIFFLTHWTWCILQYRLLAASNNYFLSFFAKVSALREFPVIVSARVWFGLHSSTAHPCLSACGTRSRNALMNSHALHFGVNSWKVYRA